MSRSHRTRWWAGFFGGVDVVSVEIIRMPDRSGDYHDFTERPGETVVSGVHIMFAECFLHWPPSGNVGLW